MQLKRKCLFFTFHEDKTFWCNVGSCTSKTNQVNWPRQTDHKQTDRKAMILLQWFRNWFRRSDFVTKWGFGQDGSGDSKNIFRIALFSQSTLFAVSLLAVSWFAVSLSRSVVVDPAKTYGQRQVGQWHYGPCTAPSRAGLLYSKIIAD